MPGRFDVRLPGATCQVTLDDDGRWHVDGGTAVAERVGGAEWRVVLDGRIHRLLVAGPTDAPWIWWEGAAYRPDVGDAARPGRARAREGAGSLSAPMPATVRAIHVAPGDRVARGDTLLVLEAMKMELPLKAPADGTVASVACEVGELVQPGIPLVALA
jgi:acetyl/propionyl-CoA carboxylase alpha subunit